MFLRKLLRRENAANINAEDLIDEEIERIVEQAFLNAETSSYRNLKRIARRLRRQERRMRSGFENRLVRRWGRAIDLYDLFLIAARQSGAEFNGENRAQAVKDQDFVFEALTRIHARGCLIASEVRALMLSGHASGALARCRSLHELAVVSYFIKEHGNDVAERYMLHENIVSAKASDEYEQHHKTLGYPPQAPDERQQVLDARNTLIARYGTHYRKPWGWAAGTLPGDPTFDRIEKAVGLAHWRPHFSMASHSVHAGFKGMTFDIGQMGSPSYSMPMLAGPSNAGLADPGHSAAISLLNCTVALLNHKVTPETVTELKVLMRLADEVGEAFIKAHQKLQMDEAQHGKQNRKA